MKPGLPIISLQLHQAKYIHISAKQNSGHFLEQETEKYFALKCDIKKFFENIDHKILLSILDKRIKDKDAMRLLEEVVESFNPGLPIGNLTSRVFANIYLNEFDQFVKQDIRVKYYVRYTDDFIIVADSKSYLENLIKPICLFLKNELSLLTLTLTSCQKNLKTNFGFG